MIRRETHYYRLWTEVVPRLDVAHRDLADVDDPGARADVFCAILPGAL